MTTLAEPSSHHRPLVRQDRGAPPSPTQSAIASVEEHPDRRSTIGTAGGLRHAINRVTVGEVRDRQRAASRGVLTVRDPLHQLRNLATLCQLVHRQRRPASKDKGILQFDLLSRTPPFFGVGEFTGYNTVRHRSRVRLSIVTLSAVSCDNLPVIGLQPPAPSFIGAFVHDSCGHLNTPPLETWVLPYTPQELLSVEESPLARDEDGVTDSYPSPIGERTH